jgi:hypothetical protein
MNKQAEISPWTAMEHKPLFQAFMSECAELKCGAWTPLHYIIHAFIDYCVSRSISIDVVSGYTSHIDKRTALLDWMKDYDVRVTGSIAHPVAVGLQLVKWPKT